MKKSELIAELNLIPGDPDIDISIVCWSDELEGDMTDTAELDMVDFDDGRITLNGRIN